MNAQETWSFSFDPVWPWGYGFGLPAFVLVAFLLIGITVWTYRGVRTVTPVRLVVLIGLRLLALAATAVILLRPSLALQAELRIPSTLICLLDASESMTIQDEFDGMSRWEHLERNFSAAEPILRELHEEHLVSVVTYRFSEDLSEYQARSKPDGKRTDFGQAFQSALSTHGRERNLRGLLVFSDGADNGTRFPPDQALADAARWRSLPCPVHTFGLGKPRTADRERDIALTDIAPSPSPVAVKGKLTVKGFIDAPGFENVRGKVRLLVDDKEVLVQEESLRKTLRNEVSLTIDAPPEKPKDGEIKVTMRIDPEVGELTSTNNEMSTFVTVTREGISVLLVDQPRYPEPQFICDALSGDPRIRVFPAWLRSDEPGPEILQLFQFDKQRYDAIIIGDVTARRLSGGDAKVLEKIRELVRDKGTGLLLMGGWSTFGDSDWRGTALEELAPVSLDARGQIKDLVKIEPTPAGQGRYLMRLSDRPDENQSLWQKLPELNGMSRLGKEKGGALVLAVRGGSNDPVLVSQDFGKGRVLAFAGDTTERWRRLGQPKAFAGMDLHARFWRQVVLWLAKQDEAEGSVWVRPDRRRLDSGEKLAFTVGLRGKGGIEAPEASFDVTVTDPNGIETAVPTARDEKGERGTFWKSDLPGEYRLVVRGRGKDQDGKPIPEERATARFVVHQGNAELGRRAADHAYLARLARTGGGSLHKVEELKSFLQELPKSSLAAAKPKPELFPDWKKTQLTPFRIALFLIFTFALCLEWLCRRVWGLV